MKSGLKRAVLVIGLLVVIAGGLLYRSVRLFHGTPEWYRRSTATLAQKEAAARRAFNKFAGIENAAASIHDNQRASAGSAAASSQPSQTITVSFSDDELNAFFEKWSNFENWKQNYEHYVDDPIILLRPGEIVLAGRVKDLDTIVSVEFQPILNEQGQLDLRLARILGGRLPLPEALAHPYFGHVTDALRTRLPAWRDGAAIQSDGAANKELISASLARLLMHTLHHDPTDPLLFLPVVEHHANVPVQVVGVEVQEHSLTVTVRPLNSREREELLARIRATDPTIDPATPP